MPLLSYLKFPCRGQILSGRRIIPDGENRGEVLFLHGGGKSDKNRTLYLAEKMAERNLASFAFDHSGCGESTGDIKKTTLKIRCEEAKSASLSIMPGKPLTICGSSMGGYISIHLLRTLPVENLVLFCPAIYDCEAFELPFGVGFSEIIRTHESWKNSDIREYLFDFSGNVLIITGDADDVIPSGVIENIKLSCLSACSLEVIVLKGCPHSIHTWLPDQDPFFTDEIITKISAWHS